MLGVPVGNNVVEDGEQWKLVIRRKRKPLLKTFTNSKDKAQSSFGTFGIPFGVSGPRPLQEARFFADQCVPAGFFRNRDALSFVRPARCAGENNLKNAVIQPWCLPCAGENTSNKVFETGSQVTCAGEPVLQSAMSVSGSRETRAVELDLKGAVSVSGSRETRAGNTALNGKVKASRWLCATASENEGIIGLRHGSVSSPSINSSMGVDLSACACVAAALPAVASASCVRTSPALRSSAFAAHASVSPLHFNSWSDTVHNSRCAGGLVPVCKSTSYTLGVGRQVPTGRRSSKGGVSGPAEDLRPVSEVEAGANFRLAGGVRGQVAGSLHFPGGNQALVPGQAREVWSHLPSTRRFLILCLCRLDQARESGN